jgi:hypothetical protein
LPEASFTVTVKVVVLVPSAVTDTGFADTLDVALLGVPAVNVTVVVSEAEPSVAVSVFSCAVVDARVATNTPDALVDPEAGENVLFDPELLNDTV